MIDLMAEVAARRGQLQAEIDVMRMKMGAELREQLVAALGPERVEALGLHPHVNGASEIRPGGDSTGVQIFGEPEARTFTFRVMTVYRDVPCTAGELWREIITALAYHTSGGRV